MSNGKRIAVAGAGAIGGWLAARLAAAGHEVSVLARGAHLEAIRARGLTLESAGATRTVAVRASDDPAELGAQDLVYTAVKAQSLPALAPRLAPLFGAGTPVVPVLNGIPWWFFHGWPGEFEGRRLASVDADGSLGRALPAARIVGAVVIGACYVREPGVVVHTGGDRWVLGEPDARTPPARCEAIAATMRAAGLGAEVSANIRLSIFAKLLGNANFNPISALTGATGDVMLSRPDLRAVCAATMREVMAIAARVGVEMNIDPEVRMAETRRLGAIKSSMLQDVEAGRTLETEGLLGALVEIADWAGVPAPRLELLAALARLKEQVARGGPADR